MGSDSKTVKNKATASQLPSLNFGKLLANEACFHARNKQLLD